MNWTRRSSRPKTNPKDLDKAGLAESGDTDEQHVAAGKKGDHGLVDDLALAKDDVADAVAYRRDAIAEAFDGVDKFRRIR